MCQGVFVIDTNVVVSGLITTSPDSPGAVILDAMLSATLIYLMSPALLQEYRSVLLRPKIAGLHGLSVAQVDAVLVDLTANAIWRDPPVLTRAPDRGDDPLWALLEAHPASSLITGDRLLLDEPPVERSVISPRTWSENFIGSR
jgi:putative PIN family toxin of toxin-antitoxin system